MGLGKQVAITSREREIIYMFDQLVRPSKIWWICHNREKWTVCYRSVVRSTWCSIQLLTKLIICVPSGNLIFVRWWIFRSLSSCILKMETGGFFEEMVLLRVTDSSISHHKRP